MKERIDQCYLSGRTTFSSNIIFFNYFLYFRDGRRGNFGDRGGERGGDRDPDAGRSDAGDWRSAPPPPMKEDNRYLKVQSYSIVESKQF